MSFPLGAPVKIVKHVLILVECSRCGSGRNGDKNREKVSRIAPQQKLIPALGSPIPV